MESILIGVIAVLAGAAAGAAAAVHFYRLAQRREEELKTQQAAAGEAAVTAAKLQTRYDEQNEQHEKMQAELAQVRDERSAGQTRIAALETELKNERDNAAEKLQLMQNAEANMKEQFKNLAQEILEEKGKKFADDSEQRLKPLQETMASFRSKIEALHSENTKERASLKTHIEQLTKNTGEVSLVAENLVNAFRGDSKTQGIWGEEMLLKLLESSGLQKGENYTVQEGHKSAEGGQHILDVVIHLPEGKHIIIDSKVSTVAYLEYSEAENEEQRAIALQRHLQSVNNHVSTLHKKNYSGSPTLNSPDFVLMFMSPESAYILALQSDSKLFNAAYDKKVVITGATTLMPILRTVANIWRLEKQQQHARDIAAQGGKLYDKLHGFLGDMNKLGRSLDTAQKSYDEARKKFSEGRGNALAQAEKLRDMGVDTKKRLPQVAEDAEESEAEAAEDTAAAEMTADATARGE